MPTTLGDMPETAPGQSGFAELSAARAAQAAEAASQAAQSAAGAVERLGGWLALLASRAPQTTTIQVPPGGMPAVAFAAEQEQERGKPGKGVAGSIKRAAMMVGQRISDLSEGRYGLAAQEPEAETKQEKRAMKRLERRAQKEAKAEQPGANVRWVPWMVGLSLGLMIGLVGVVYWQRRRLQALWQQTSQRMQQATGGMRQRMETTYHQPSPQMNNPTEASGYRSLGSAAPVNEGTRQVNGRMESTLP
jgi:hypothetical protein